MSGYTVLANRYRPRTFDEVVGQSGVARVLEHSIRADRAGHAFLFGGPRGVGKTSMARILAKAFNCLEGGREGPCGTCSVCRAIDGPGECMDVVEIDGASHNRVENVRDLIENLRFRPVEARYRVYIVDEVHMLSTAAFNALLKTLEEPPDHARFILATTEPLKVPETIRSRCQLFDFRLLTVEQISARLEVICAAEGLQVADGLLPRVARQARGSLRDALVLLDQLIAFGDGSPSHAAFEQLTGRLSGELLHCLLEAALEGESRAVLEACARAIEGGARAGDLLEQVTESLQGLLVTVVGGHAADRTDEERARLTALAAKANLDQVVAMLDVVTEAAGRLRQRHDPRLVVEMAMLALSRVELLQPVVDLLAGAAPQQEARSVVARAGSPAGKRTEPAPRPEGDEFARRFIEEASRGSRSLRMELEKVGQIRLEGDEVVLAMPTQPTAGLFENDVESFRRRLEQAARKVAGRPLRLRVEREGAGSRPSAPGGEDSEREAFERRMIQEWPGSERVDR